MSEQAEAESVELEPSPSPGDTAVVIRPAATYRYTSKSSKKHTSQCKDKKGKRLCLVLPSYPVRVEKTQ